MGKEFLDISSAGFFFIWVGVSVLIASLRRVGGEVKGKRLDLDIADSMITRIKK